MVWERQSLQSFFCAILHLQKMGKEDGLLYVQLRVAKGHGAQGKAVFRGPHEPHCMGMLEQMRFFFLIHKKQATADPLSRSSIFRGFCPLKPHNSIEGCFLFRKKNGQQQILPLLYAVRALKLKAQTLIADIHYAAFLRCAPGSVVALPFKRQGEAEIFPVFNF